MTEAAILEKIETLNSRRLSESIRLCATPGAGWRSRRPARSRSSYRRERRQAADSLGKSQSGTRN